MSSTQPPDPDLIEVPTKKPPDLDLVDVSPDLKTQHSTPAKQNPPLEGIRPLSTPSAPSKCKQPVTASNRTPQKSNSTSNSKR